MRADNTTNGRFSVAPGVTQSAATSWKADDNLCQSLCKGAPAEVHANDYRLLLCLYNETYIEFSMDREIYNRIAIFRAESGLSRKDLAERVGVHPQTIGFLERGDYKPSLDLALRLAEVFAVPIELLFSFSPFESVAASLRRTLEQNQ